MKQKTKYNFITIAIFISFIAIFLLMLKISVHLMYFGTTIESEMPSMKYDEFEIEQDENIETKL